MWMKRDGNQKQVDWTFNKNYLDGNIGGKKHELETGWLTIEIWVELIRWRCRYGWRCGLERRNTRIRNKLRYKVLYN